MACDGNETTTPYIIICHYVSYQSLLWRVRNRRRSSSREIRWLALLSELGSSGFSLASHSSACCEGSPIITGVGIPSTDDSCIRSTKGYISFQIASPNIVFAVRLDPSSGEFSMLYVGGSQPQKITHRVSALRVL